MHLNLVSSFLRESIERNIIFISGICRVEKRNIQVSVEAADALAKVAH